MNKIRQLIILALGLVSFFAGAAFNVYEFDDNQEEKRFKHLINELRCPKCQNNNLSDSNSPLATDIKNYVYQSVQKGDSDKQITDFLISRYGQFITYRPQTRWIWVLPMAIGAIALLVTVVVIRRKRQESPSNQSKTTPSMESLIKQHQKDKLS